MRLAILRRYIKGLYYLLGSVCFVACLSWHYQQYQTATEALLTSTVSQLTVSITEPPQVYPDYTQLNATILSGPAAGYNLTLRWAQPPALATGQQWRVGVLVKPVHGHANPAGVNAKVAALMSQRVAVGQVTPGPHVLLGHEVSLRQKLVERIEYAVRPLVTAPLLTALAVGQREFSDELWLGLQHAGLGHLMAISGLHIGLVFGWIMWLGRASRGIVAIRQQQVLLLLLALAVALSYAWLADFAIPTVRASVALAILVICRSQLARMSLSRFWLLLVALLLIIQPFWSLSASFWLSVLAVAIIFIVIWRFPLPQYRWQARLGWFMLFHLLLSAMMTLLGILLFNGFSPLMLLSNLLFVPWCSLVAIPLLLLSLLFTLAGFDVSGLWQLTDVAFRPLLWWLELSASLPLWWPLNQPSAVLMVGLVILLPAISLFWGKAGLIMLALCLLILSNSALQAPQWQLHLLDSGRRQIVLLQYGRQALLYYAAAGQTRQDIAAYPLVPVLRQLGIEQLDFLLFRQQRTERSRQWAMLTGFNTGKHDLTAFSQQLSDSSCQQLPADYLGVRLEVLSTTNADNCMLRLTIGTWRVLLPGLLDSATEQALLTSNAGLAADVMLLANNGIAAVNSLPMLQQVNPALALNAAAFMSGYQQPAVAVEQRLALLGVPLLNTADYGAISIQFNDNNLQLLSWGQRRLPFWLEKPPAIAETLATTR